MKKLMFVAAAAAMTTGLYAAENEVYNFSFTVKQPVTVQKAGADWLKQGSTKITALMVNGETAAWSGSGKTAAWYDMELNDNGSYQLNKGDANWYLTFAGRLQGWRTLMANGFGKQNKDEVLASGSGYFTGFDMYGNWSLKINAAVAKKLNDGVALEKAYKFPAGIADDVKEMAKDIDEKTDLDWLAQNATTIADYRVIADKALEEALTASNVAFDAWVAQTTAQNRVVLEKADWAKAYQKLASDYAVADGVITIAQAAYDSQVAATNYLAGVVVTNYMNYTNLVAREFAPEWAGKSAEWQAACVASNEVYETSKAKLDAETAELNGKYAENLKAAEQKKADYINTLAEYATIAIADYNKTADKDKQELWVALKDKDGNVTNLVGQAVSTGVTVCVKVIDFADLYAGPTGIKEKEFDATIVEFDVVKGPLFEKAETVIKTEQFCYVTGANKAAAKASLEAVTYLGDGNCTWASWDSDAKIYKADNVWAVLEAGTLAIAEGEMWDANWRLDNVNTFNKIVKSCETAYKALSGDEAEAYQKKVCDKSSGALPQAYNNYIR